MRYMPILPKDREEMLKKIGVSCTDELFRTIPDEIRIKSSIDIPQGMSELDLRGYFEELASRNGSKDQAKLSSFIGAGAYEHFIPAAVDSLAGRAEFYTAYTPYQPELSQGTLQAVFEFQSMVSAISGMEVANASMYDGASALAEAVLMAERISRKKTVLMSALLHPEYRKVFETYTSNKDLKVIDIPFNDEGRTDLSKVSDSSEVSCVVVQYPNFFGVIDDVIGAKRLCTEKGALLIVVTTEPAALGILKSPGELGADIFVAEGQSFGNPLNFGGPHLGIMAAKKDYIRSMPGRIVSRTVDKEGKTGYVLFMATREQHIRREKATSNICTNNALCALRALMYLSLLGGRGLKALAEANLANASYLKERLLAMRGVDIKFRAPTFNEFVFSTSIAANELLKKLEEEGILGGFPLGRYYEQYKNAVLVTVTETKTKKELDAYCNVIKKCI